MSTKFILHGGASNRKSPENEKFYREIVDSVEKSDINILCIYFARPKHRWNDSFKENKEAFNSVDTQKTLNIQMATYEDFENQLTGADIVFINGGFRGHLKETLNSIENFKEKIQGKIVVGISAGANILATYYFSQEAQNIQEGAKILPIKMFCHYEKTLANELASLEKYESDLPVYKIPEENYIVLKH
jgi:peptidase E